MLRPHVGIFGKRNVGKSSLINSFAGQDISIVSQHAGTTTDPVKKLMEIEGIGPTQFIDTAGIDDLGEVGLQRVERSLKSIEEVNLAIVVLINNEINSDEQKIIDRLLTLKTPYFFVHHKNDLTPLSENFKDEIEHRFDRPIFPFSSRTHSKQDLTKLVELLAAQMPESAHCYNTILGDLIKAKDIVLMVTPIDAEAPEGRMILPQVQALRDALDHNAIVVMLRESELKDYFSTIKVYPKMVVTDSQVFNFVDSVVPKEVPLTSFSILYARLKGDWENFYKGTPAISTLKDGDRILIYESCSHHVLKDDIGRVKIPRWVSEFTQKKLEFEVVSGKDHPQYSLQSYSIVIQCGGCMMTKKQIHNRMQDFTDANIPTTNYGMAIAYCHGIFHRATELF